MKKVHYRNIGFPKSGTTWLWEQLMMHPQVDGKLAWPYKEFKGRTLTEYQGLYEMYDVSINLNTHVFVNNLGDSHFASPKNISSYTTHITCSLRNPYEILNSMYNMTKNSDRERTLVNRTPNPKFTGNLDGYLRKNIIVYTNFKKMFDEWDSCPVKVKYLFYDDLVSNPEKFFHDICDHIGIERHYKDIGIVWKTEVNDPLAFDNAETIEYINKNISVIEERLNRDLSHWKK